MQTNKLLKYNDYMLTCLSFIFRYKFRCKTGQKCFILFFLYLTGPISCDIHLCPVWFLQYQLHRDHAGSFRRYGATPPDGARTGCRQSNDCWERCLFHDGLYCWTSIRVQVETAKTPVQCVHVETVKGCLSMYHSC